MKRLVGKKWGELNEGTKNELLDSISNDNLHKVNGEVIIDFNNGLSIAGFVRQTEEEAIITIDDKAIIYNPCN